MPEVLWACLVRAVLPRDQALGVFRDVAVIAREFIDSPMHLNALIPTHTNLAQRHPALIPRIVQLIAAKPLGYAALRPLLLLDSLPGREYWVAAIAAEPGLQEFDLLADSVLEFFDHQSEHSTDVRWLLVIFGMLTRKVRFPTTMAQRVDEIANYPNQGDLHSVRPSIRSKEQMMWIEVGNESPAYEWSAAFWRECHGKTPCILAVPEEVAPPTRASEDVGPIVFNAMNDLSDHWIATSRTTAVDAAHEGAFAFVLYALACLVEILKGNRRRIAGRLLLRTLTECRITFAYLLAKNDPDLWLEFRRYGAGQAKLVLLKVKEAAMPPHSISIEKLEQLANKDVWQEFVDINLGSWAGIDLRRMADESGTKQLYDAHYGWNSGFAHSHWSAMRDTTLSNCLNPLHRGHRIPLSGERKLGDVRPDALEIGGTIIAELMRAYPGRTVTLQKSQQADANSPPQASPDAAV
jgi:hypothetical protein